MSTVSYYLNPSKHLELPCTQRAPSSPVPKSASPDRNSTPDRAPAPNNKTQTMCGVAPSASPRSAHSLFSRRKRRRREKSIGGGTEAENARRVRQRRRTCHLQSSRHTLVFCLPNAFLRLFLFLTADFRK